MIFLTTWNTYFTDFTGPWPWYIGGLAISSVMLLLMYFGKGFGISETMRTMCSGLGAGKFASFFDYNWKAQSWNLVFVLGCIAGGYISTNYLIDNPAVTIHPDLIPELKQYGLTKAGTEYYPTEIYSWENIFTLRTLVFLIGGGFLIGFGARYAGGCTSGHAISGLSNLQPASLVAVISFFIGGLIMTYFFLPSLLQL